MQKRLFWLIVVLALVLPFSASLAQEATEEAVAPIELPAVDPLSVTGDIITAGSSTVFPLSERMSEVFHR
jgi:phosphate transport system substrate-binding protein